MTAACPALFIFVELIPVIIFMKRKIAETPYTVIFFILLLVASSRDKMKDTKLKCIWM
jgi:hypothetical protein